MKQLNSREIKTISSLEIAEMLGISHKEILRKLDGSKDRKGYIQILGEHQMVPTDYFIPDTYLTSQNKEMPCYQFTKLGCDFIANKFSGEKGVLFTAAYVKRFYEMEQAVLNAPDFRFLNGFANLLNMLTKTMKAQGHSPEMVAKQVRLLCDTYHVPMVDTFVIPTYEQLRLNEKDSQELLM